LFPIFFTRRGFHFGLTTTNSRFPVSWPLPNNVTKTVTKKTGAERAQAQPFRQSPSQKSGTSPLHLYNSQGDGRWFLFKELLPKKPFSLARARSTHCQASISKLLSNNDSIRHVFIKHGREVGNNLLPKSATKRGLYREALRNLGSPNLQAQAYGRIGLPST
jgi:hypothetical protein